MKSFWTTTRIILACLLFIVILAMSLSVMWTFCLYIAGGSAILFCGLLGMDLFMEYTEKKAIFDKQQKFTYEKLVGQYGEVYAQNVFDQKKFKDDFLKENVKYKIIGIVMIILSVYLLLKILNIL